MVQMMMRQFPEGTSFKEACEQGIYMLGRDGRKVNRIRHIRCYGKNVANPVKVKRHTYPSDKEYKQHVLAALGDGSVYALCEYSDGLTTEYKRYTYMEISENRKSGLEDIPAIYPNKKGQPLQLARKIMKGDMLLIYEKTPDELLYLDKLELSKRLYKVQFFEGEKGITLFHHLLSDSKTKEKGNGGEKKRNKGESIKDYKKLPPIIRCSINGFLYLQKGVDFEFTKDGIILKHI
jgi:CRISPR-associated endonuclease Csn1